MRFTDAKLNGAKIIDLEPHRDERGFFARCWCDDEFKEAGVPMTLAQASIAYTKQAGALRGLHFQHAPYGEDKLIRCVRGAAYVAVVDIRPNSSTYRQWFSVQLTEANYRMLYIPKGCAQGYQTLLDHTEILYHISQYYHPSAKRGIRYNDPAFNIPWPMDVTVISEADQGWPSFTDNSPDIECDSSEFLLQS